MKLLKPAWVNHEENPIFSIDIHPDGTRFATGGLGQDSTGRIVIWNMAPVLEFRAKNGNNNGVSANADAPKILCQLDHHNACVNCVRWSNSGRYLASGGDDKAIMIWKLISKNRPTLLTANAFGKPTYETWKPISDLRNHRGDILHLAWSPEDKYLASASVDNKVIIWDAQQFPLIIQELNAHTSLVKGVTWDPIGKYLATQSDDKTLKIWRTSDWQHEHTISAPFHECGGTTHVLRLDWSPDGQYLVSAHAMNKGGPTAQIIEREEWKTDKDFVGHRKAVTCVRFNPRILQTKKNRFSVAALGSRDRSISVWSTALTRPLVVISDLFTNSVMDVSWSACGKILMACSWDGTAAAAVFKKSEIGDALTAEEKLRVHQKLYGDRISMKPTDIVPSLEVFLARKKEKEKELSQASNKLDQAQPIKTSPERLVPDSESQSQELVIRGPIDKQIETRTSDGKRRITPKFLLPSSDGFDVQTSNESNSNHFGTFDSDKKDQVGLREKMISNISEVKISSEPQNNGVEKPSASISSDFPSQASSLNSTTSTNQDNDDTPSVILEKIEPDCSTNGEAHDSPPILEKQTVVQDKAPKPEINQTEADKGRSKPNVDSNRVSLIGVKRKLNVAEEMKPPAKFPKKSKFNTPSSTSTSSSIQPTNTLPSVKDDRSKVNPATSSSSIAPQGMVNGHPPSAVSISPAKARPGIRTMARLTPMKSEPYSFRTIKTKKGISYTIEADNAPSVKGAFILRCRHDAASLNGLQWSICTAYPICQLSGDSVRVIALTEDASVHVLGLKGRYVLPPIILHSQANKMFHHGSYLLIVTVRATLHLWNIHTKKCILKSESIAPLLDQCTAMDQSTKTPIEVAQMSVTQLGSPVVILTNGKAFHFNIDMQSWMHYVDPRMMSTNPSHMEWRPFCSWQNPANNKLTFSELRNLKQAEPYVVTQIKLKLATATELQLSDGVEMSLVALAKTLAVHGLKKELRQLCEDLLGPTHSSASAEGSSTWSPTIVGVKKREVLRTILRNLLEDLEWQDFYVEFNECLTEFEERIEREANQANTPAISAPTAAPATAEAQNSTNMASSSSSLQEIQD